MAERQSMSAVEIHERRDREDRANFDGWQGWRNQYRAARDAFQHTGGLPDAPPTVAEVLDELSQTKQPGTILEALARELEANVLFHTVYVDFINEMHQRGLIDDQRKIDFLAAGKAVVEIKAKVKANDESVSGELADQVID